MNISSRQLKAFLLTARLGNFTRAAEKMHLTQAGLSVMMRELEAQLDARLFDRTTRTVTLTGAGEKFLPAAMRALEAIEAAAVQIGEIGEQARHTLRIAATPLVASNLLPAICQRFRLLHPEVAIHLVDCDLKQVQALVDSGEADMGIGFFFKAARGIERSLLHSFQLMRVKPADGAKAGKVGTVRWPMLKDDTLISLPADNPIQQLVESHLAAIGRGNEDKLTFNYFETLIAMVAAGMGVAIVPSFALLASRRHQVRCDLLTEPAVSLGLYRITKRGRSKSPAMAEFTDTLMSTMSSLMGEAVGRDAKT
ncbi:LysR family transcriptional regulator [Undibacterium sp. TJN25]|uniref:LysR family transcriptional regulator n=1 Tax=Undibacterium sp. TJN25 TaxID=3413056 RepID=UPI003BF19E2A